MKSHRRTSGDVRRGGVEIQFTQRNLLASGNAVWQAQIAESRGDDYSLALALVAGIVAVVIAVVTFFGPEKRST